MTHPTTAEDQARVESNEKKAMTGIELIAAERARQVSEEGWTPEHDDNHNLFELSRAAWCYIKQAQFMSMRTKPMGDWPWHDSWWKPSPDRVRNLAKAGALIAAEIDRLQRAALAKAVAHE